MKGSDAKAAIPADPPAAKNLHERLETWVNEGGAGDDDPSSAKKPQEPGASTPIRPRTAADR